MAEGIPDRSRPSRRRAPPASPGLIAASTHSQDRRDRLRRRHPAQVKGKLKITHMSEIVDAALANLASDKPKTPSQVAIAIGADASGESIKKAVRAAKAAFASKVGDYVAIHLLAAQNAAEKGDARPAQWALENIVVDGERVVDTKAASVPQQQGAVSIGIMMGGIPAPRNMAAIDTTATVANDE